MALPIWALYMRACYEDESLNISKEDFEKPIDLSIEVDCSKYNSGDENTDSDTDDNQLDEIDFL